jgi:uncharacterized cupin superfamily protein
MPKIDVSQLKPIVGGKYPKPFDEPCRARERRRLGEGAGLTQFGVNLMRLPPGAWSSQRHWHAREDDDWGEYSDIDMVFKPSRYSQGGGFAHKDGKPY